MIVLWLAVGLLAGASEAPPVVEQEIIPGWGRHYVRERKRREDVEAAARERLNDVLAEVLPDAPEDEVEDYGRKLDELLRTFTFSPLPSAGQDAQEVANRLVATLIADAEAEFDRYVLGLIREKDERDAIATILLCI